MYDFSTDPAFSVAIVPRELLGGRSLPFGPTVLSGGELGQSLFKGYIQEPTNPGHRLSSGPIAVCQPVVDGRSGNTSRIC